MVLFRVNRRRKFEKLVFSSRVSVRARVYVFFVILFEDEQLKIFRIRSVFHFLVKQLTLLFSSK